MFDEKRPELGPFRQYIGSYSCSRDADFANLRMMIAEVEKSKAATASLIGMPRLIEIGQFVMISRVVGSRTAGFG